jgi:hypothetical protein
MYRIGRDLCSRLPKVSTLQPRVDIIAANVFSHGYDVPFVQSSDPPDSRYGIHVDETSLSPHNRLVPTFSSYGPNERYLVNKIIFGVYDLLYIVGGIGVGKTRFLRWFMSEVAPSLTHEPEMDRTACPRIAYIDFNQLELTPFVGPGRTDAVYTQLLELLCLRVEASLIDGFFGIETELTVVWDALVSSRNQSGHGMVNLAWTRLLPCYGSEMLAQIGCRRSFMIPLKSES